MSSTSTSSSSTFTDSNYCEVFAKALKAIEIKGLDFEAMEGTALEVSKVIKNILPVVNVLRKSKDKAALLEALIETEELLDGTRKMLHAHWLAGITWDMTLNAATKGLCFTKQSEEDLIALVDVNIAAKYLQNPNSLDLREKIIYRIKMHPRTQDPSWQDKIGRLYQGKTAEVLTQITSLKRTINGCKITCIIL